MRINIFKAQPAHTNQRKTEDKPPDSSLKRRIAQPERMSDTFLKSSGAQPNFKGRFINQKNLNRIGNTGIYTSLASSFAMMTAGIADPLMTTVNGVLTTIGAAAHITKAFLPGGERFSLKAHTEFTKAQTLEQAQNFAKENFKIKDFSVDDLYVANWINKGLTELSNLFKGKTYMPDKVIYKDFGGDTLDHYSGAMYRCGDNTMFFNKFPFENTDKILQNLLGKYPEKISSIPFGSIENMKRHLQRLDRYKNAPDTMTKASKLALATETNNIGYIFMTPEEKMKRYTETLINSRKNLSVHEQLELFDMEIYGHVYNGLFDNIFHEAGHMFDFQSESAFTSILAGRKMPQIMQTAREELVMPDYALSDFREYRVEIFTGILDGEKYPKQIMDIFHKYNRMNLPKRTV